MIGNTFQFAWEVKLIEWCQTCIPASLIKVMELASYVGDTIFLVGIMVIAYLCIDKKFGRRMIFNTILSFMVAAQIKNIFKRRRPYFDNDNIECLKVVDKNYDAYDIRKQGFSFPSMHSSNISTAMGSLYEFYKKHIYLVIAIICSLIVGVSRFVLGCHYPTDVLVGWTLGIIFIIIFSKIQDKLEDKYLYCLVFAIGLIGFFFCESAEFYSGFGIAIGFIFCEIVDKKYINFENTKNIIAMVLRIAVACVSFLLIAEGAKLLLPVDIQEANTLFAHLFRTARYAIGSFVGLGLTPFLYKYKLFK